MPTINDIAKIVGVSKSTVSKALNDAGDISVIGLDDAAFSAHTEPPLTTVRQDRNALGRCGYYALASLLGQTYISSLLLRAELVVRGSAGPVRAGGGSGSQ